MWNGILLFREFCVAPEHYISFVPPSRKKSSKRLARCLILFNYNRFWKKCLLPSLEHILYSNFAWQLFFWFPESLGCLATAYTLCIVLCIDGSSYCGLCVLFSLTQAISMSEKSQKSLLITKVICRNQITVTQYFLFFLNDFILLI